MIPSGCVEECPGCRHKQLSEEQSLAQKQAWAESMLAELVPESVFERIRRPRPALGYRRKILLHAEYGEGGWRFGLLKRRGREDPLLIPIPDCPVHAKNANAVFRELSRLLPADIPLRFVALSGTLLTLVIKAKRCKDPEGLESLGGHGVTGVFMNFHPQAGTRIFSKEWKKLWGDDTALGEDGLHHGPASFRQQIPDLHEDSLREAEAFLNAGVSSAVFDLYAGIGAGLRRWNSDCVVGVELGGEECRMAEQNAPKARLLRGRVEDRIPQLREIAASREELLLYVNPPRTGLADELRGWIGKERKIKKVAYLSCSMGTLARDLRALGKFRVRRLIPYDFFPLTDHVEALALLERTE